jgi:hypothetical protein
MAIQPHMDEKGLMFFKNRMEQSRCYLEYGSGGSTVYSVNVAKVGRVISVDTDRGWVDEVRNAIDSEFGENCRLIHVDFGDIGEWGTPKTEICHKEFWRYPVLPWRHAKEVGAVPDTVLVDGRFRVACFLYTLLVARVGAIVMFDDYFDRPEYFVVERYCRVVSESGRMAVFSVTREFDLSELVVDFSRYSLVAD